MALSRTRIYEALSTQPTAAEPSVRFILAVPPWLEQSRSCERRRNPTPWGAAGRTAPGGGFIWTPDRFSLEDTLLSPPSWAPPHSLCPEGLITQSCLRECSTIQVERRFEHYVLAVCSVDCLTLKCLVVVVFLFYFEILQKVSFYGQTHMLYFLAKLHTPGEEPLCNHLLGER